MQLRRLETAEQDIADLDQRIAEKLEPYAVQHLLLMRIPGVDWLVAAVLIAEFGTDMSVFVSCYHLAAWAAFARATRERRKAKKRSRPQRQHPLAHDPGRRERSPHPERGAAISRTSIIA